MLSDWFLLVSVCNQGLVLKINSRADSACDSFHTPALLPALPAHCCAEGMLCHKRYINQPTSKAVMQHVHLWFLCWHWLLALGKPRVSAALLCKDSPCSLNNSKDDVCVTPRVIPGSWRAVHGVLAVQHHLHCPWGCSTGNWENPDFPKQKPSKNKNNTPQNRRRKSNSFITEHFILPDSSSRLTSDDQACFWLSTDPAQEEKEKAVLSCSHWSVSGSSMPAWECIRLPLVWTGLVSVFLPR